MAKIASETQESKVRLSYPRGVEITDRKKIKEVLVEMSKASVGWGTISVGILKR